MGTTRHGAPMAVAWAAAATVLTAAGCESTPKVTPGESDALGMLVARDIRIQPFTKIRSFDDDAIPDGIDVLVRATDQFGDPVKAVGHFYFELYSYRKASGDPKGERIEFWDRTIASAKDVRLYWDRTAQMYEFPLAWTQGQPPAPNRKYILTVTYRAPWDETFEDQFVMDFTLSRPERLAGE
jgi:hypothetical protein